MTMANVLDKVAMRLQYFRESLRNYSDGDFVYLGLPEGISYFTFPIRILQETCTQPYWGDLASMGLFQIGKNTCSR
jgi:hypothetical protein